MRRMRGEVGKKTPKNDNISQQLDFPLSEPPLNQIRGSFKMVYYLLLWGGGGVIHPTSGLPNQPKVKKSSIIW